MKIIRRTILVRGCQKTLIIVFVTAVCCSLLLLNRCRLAPETDPPADDFHPSPTQWGKNSGGGVMVAKAVVQEESQRSAYTRHLLQQIAQLEQEVAALHAAAAVAGVKPVPYGSSNVVEIHPVPLSGNSPPTGPNAPPDGVVGNVKEGGVASTAPSGSNASASLHFNGPCGENIKEQILRSEVVKGVPLNNEYEVIPFTHFTWSRVYPSELGLGKRVVEKPIGYRRKDLLAALTSALEHLNNLQNEPNRFTVDDFIEGSYRTIPTVGMQYELIFREKAVNPASKDRSRVSVNSESTRSHLSSNNISISSTTTENVDRSSRSDSKSNAPTAKQKPKKIPTAGVKTVTLTRPFATLSVVKSKSSNGRQLINLILPLSGRLQTFQRFMTKFVNVILPHDRRVFLTVVYFGDEGLQKARNVLTKASREANFRMVKLLTLNETFSRGKALQVGASHWSGGDVLLFMCDVDVVFSTRFLDRCRLNTSPGKTVYYPILFSLYNPGLVYPLQGKPIPEELDQLIISRDTGFWRDFGYGMTCQYRSDFINVNGFDQQIIGWGGEDVLLYRKYVRSDLNVIRTPDPGIFHLWHPKYCSPGLPGDQYRACISSRALSEASHAHLGMVAFKKDLERHPVGSKILPGINTAEKNINSGPGGSYQAMGEI